MGVRIFTLSSDIKPKIESTIISVKKIIKNKNKMKKLKISF